MNRYSFKRTVIPTKLIHNSTLRKIEVTNSKFIIEKFEIFTKDKKIDTIVITEGKHPNCNPEDGVFCIPDYLKRLTLNHETLKIIIEMFKIFNFESAYYLPWGSIEYAKED